MIKYRTQIAIIKIEEHKSEILSNEAFDFVTYDLAYAIFQRLRLFLLKIKEEFKK